MRPKAGIQVSRNRASVRRGERRLASGVRYLAIFLLDGSCLRHGYVSKPSSETTRNLRRQKGTANSSRRLFVQMASINLYFYVRMCIHIQTPPHTHTHTHTYTPTHTHTYKHTHMDTLSTGLITEQMCYEYYTSWRSKHSAGCYVNTYININSLLLLIS